MLNEVTVTASDRSMSADKDTYIPTSQTKKISANGTDLIRNIGITTLQVSALDGTISTLSGEPVSTFIDFRPASRADVRNIRAEDVKRVDVYDSPDDPRFGGARHVVNYVMAEYEFGGYTKFDAGQYTALNSGMYSAYSKFAYKKMIYDVGVDFEYMHHRHHGYDCLTAYTFPERTIEQTRRADKSLTSTRSIAAFVRPIYQTQKLSISNTFSFKNNTAPDNYTTEQELFNSPDYISGTQTTSTDNSGHSFAWQGNYQLFLSKTLTLVVDPSASYGKNKQYYDYASGTSAVRNIVDEKAWKGAVNVSLQKIFGQQSLTAKVFGELSGNDIDYSGNTVSRQEGRKAAEGLRLQANLTFGKLTLFPNLTLYANHQKINGVSNTDVNLKYFIYASYFFSEKNKLQLSSDYFQQSVPQSSMTDIIQLQNQIYAIAGNSDLKTARWLSVTAQHTYMPVKNLSLTPYAVWQFNDRTICRDYIPMEIDGRDVMLGKVVNSGHSNKYVYGLSANCNLFNNSLHLNANVSGTTRSVHGPFTASCTHVDCNLEARYNFSNFYVSAYYQNKGKSISAFGIERTPDFYFFTAGWGNGNWQLSATAYRLFSTSYRGGFEEITTRYYKNFQHEYTPFYHCRFSFSATYSFSYGKKKVSHNIDTALPSGPESQILK
ncbi:MAG: hypothetical protein K2L76_06260 [Muribaculaceae bacterium]|nr:hypothetical protein [Muribaculaceae bacterium]